MSKRFSPFPHQKGTSSWSIGWGKTENFKLLGNGQSKSIKMEHFYGKKRTFFWDTQFVCSATTHVNGNSIGRTESNSGMKACRFPVICHAGNNRKLPVMSVTGTDSTGNEYPGTRNADNIGCPKTPFSGTLFLSFLPSFFLFFLLFCLLYFFFFFENCLLRVRGPLGAEPLTPAQRTQ